ncbi:hypothetical protein [Streptomyces sp. CAU 1734]|uniref:hypothetical protein n=1 Tax=Streptomyces sp. CAU 1734 TaxID=3140360 RepID=UPI00326118BD
MPTLPEDFIDLFRELQRKVDQLSLAVAARPLPGAVVDTGPPDPDRALPVHSAGTGKLVEIVSVPEEGDPPPEPAAG